MVERQLLRYFLKALVLYLVWYFVYRLWLGPEGRLDAWLNETIAQLANKALVFLGFSSCQEGTSVCINGTSTVMIGNGCNGLEIYYIFAAFIVIYDGFWFYKVGYILFGTIVIFLSNIGRVMLLSLDRFNDVNLFRFNHKYTYVFILYSLVFLLWLGWIVYFSTKKLKNA